MNNFVMIQELAAMRHDELLAKAARRRLARASRDHLRKHGWRRHRLSAPPAPPKRLDGPAPREADFELAPAVSEPVDRPAPDRVGSFLP